MIIVFGSLNVDIVMPVGHFPAPRETVLCSADYLSVTGGKGSNQAVAAARAGAKVAFVGKVGDDAFGRRSVNNLKNHGIWASGIGISERPTGCSTIAVDSHGVNKVISAPGANLDATSDQLPDEILTPDNLLLTQLDMNNAETFAVLKRAKALGCVTILDASPASHIPAEVLKSLDYLIMNQVEAMQLAEGFGLDGKDTAALAGILAEMGDLTCIITLEDTGAIAAHGQKLYRIGALKVDAVDTTGAGDVFCGVFAAALQNGLPWLQALHRASIGASLSCQGMGAQASTPVSEDIDAQLDKLPPAVEVSP